MASNMLGWTFGALLLAIAAANLLLVHPVPAAAYVLAALLYLPPVGQWMEGRLRKGQQRNPRSSLLPVAKVAIGIAIVMFTLGVSDLGDMIV